MFRHREGLSFASLWCKFGPEILAYAGREEKDSCVEKSSEERHRTALTQGSMAIGLRDQRLAETGILTMPVKIKVRPSHQGF